MKKGKLVLVLLVVMMSFTTITADVYGESPEQGKKSWYIPFFASMEVPEQLIIIDGKDIINEMAKLMETAGKSYPTRNNQNSKKISPEEIGDVFDENQIHFYQFALKENGSYQTAFAFVGKVPDEWNKPAMKFFSELQHIDQKGQQEIRRNILTKMGEAYTMVPELKNLLQVEILEFYPFEKFTSKNSQVVSVGGSIALYQFKMIQPAAFKIYFINKNSKIYLLGVINSGPNRKMWDAMTRDMLSTAQWSLVD